MAAVEVSSVTEEWRAPLRFAAGLAAGLGGGTLANATMSIARNRMPLLLARTLDMARARVALMEAQRLVGVRQMLGLSVPTAMIRTQVRLAREIRALETYIRNLRDLYGAQALALIETAHQTALTNLARLDSRLAAPGLSPGQRALLRNSMELRDARTLVREASGRVQAAYDSIDRAILSFRRGAFAAQADSAAHATDYATRNADALERLVEQRMRDVGVPNNLIGDMPLGGGTRSAFHPLAGDGGGVTVGRGINVDKGVFNPNLLGDPAAGGVARTWSRARLRDRIDAVIAHEFEEATAGTHGAALRNAPNTRLNISPEARQLLREMAGGNP